MLGWRNYPALLHGRSLGSLAGTELQRLQLVQDCSYLLLGKKQSTACLSLRSTAHKRMIDHRSKKGGKGGDDEEDDAEDDEE